MEVPVQPLAPDQCLAFFPGDERVAGGGSNRWQSEPVGDFAFEQEPVGSMIGARYRRPTRLGEDRCESDDGLVVDQGRMGVCLSAALVPRELSLASIRFRCRSTSCSWSLQRSMMCVAQ
jgi:hypothetical protein